MTLYKGNKVIAGSRSYIGNIGDIKYTTRVDLPFGGSWCDGSIKLKAQFPTVYQMLIDGKLQALDIATYESTLNLNGSCGFFGLDTATESFRVPSLNDVYIKSGQVAEGFGAESLPNISGSFRNNGLKPDVISNQTSGAFYRKDYAGIGCASTVGNYNTAEINIDASLSSSTYQDGAKVNPDHVKYRAYVVLYTGADTNVDITKEIQLNNPFSFGMSQWFESDPKNASWLLSDGAFHSGVIYESFYNWLVSEYNNPDMLPNKINADIVGNPTISDGVVSGFGNGNYLILPQTLKTNSSSWEFVVNAETSTTSIQQAIWGNGTSADFTVGCLWILAGGKLLLELTSNNSSWNITATSTLTVDANTSYFYKTYFTGSQYKVDVSKTGEFNGEEVNYISINNSNSISMTACISLGANVHLSGAYFLGSLDLSKSHIKIDGKSWWSGYHNAVRKTVDDYSDYDYVINTESNSFRLPVKTHLASGNAVVGNGMTLGVINGIEKFGLAEYNGGTYANYTAYGTDVGTALSHVGGTTIERSFGITTDPTKSGIETSSNGLKLYFYVGETVQDANLINASKVLDLLAKLESYDYVVESKVATDDDPRWYRVYKSGWVEQGGKTTATGITVSFLKPFKNNQYSSSLTPNYCNEATIFNFSITNKTEKSMFVYTADNTGVSYRPCDWEAKGQGA